MDNLLTLTEAASQLRCSSQTVRGYIADGKLQATQKGRGTKRKHCLIPSTEIRRLEAGDTDLRIRVERPAA